jgi:eukaryotic-like serine/threonine-protein kinase
VLRKILTYLAIFAASILAVALVLNFIMTVFVGGRQVDVPDVRGLTEKAAVDALHHTGLGYQRNGEEYSIDYAESTVVMQDPPAGRTVKQGRKVFITVSRGAEFREIPYCLGKTLRAARLFIERAGFTVGSVALASKPGSFTDEVLATDPRSGERAASGTVVDILASKGAPRTKYIMPDLRGKSYLAVRLQLERSGMSVEATGNEGDLGSGKSRVKAQEPPPGFIVAAGDTISLSVSAKYDGRVDL